jgi:FkbM family methyltransferase
MVTASVEVGSPVAAITKVEPIDGFGSCLHLLCLRTVAVISRVFRNRGMQSVTWSLAQHLFGAEHFAILLMAGGGRLRIRLADGYWTRLLIPDYIYEPETWSALARALSVPGVFFLDCGANIGYWSVACGQFVPPGHIVAVEACPPNFEQLAENARLNAGRFTAVWNALWNKDGEDAVIVSHELRHAGSSIVDRREKVGKSGYVQHVVKTVTLDTLCSRYAIPPRAKLVVKLDVEGAEIETLCGGRRTFSEHDALLIYEDHGQDPDCRTSKFVLQELGFAVFHCGKHGSVRRMETLDDIRDLKTNVHVGYNFAACSSGSSFVNLLTEPSSSGPHEPPSI